MIERLTLEEEQIAECISDPICLAESLFSNYDNLSLMEEENLGNLRIGQLPLLSYEYIIDNDETKTEKQNFQIKKGAGDLYCLGGRLFGKTLCVEKIDLLLTLLFSDLSTVGFSSYDAIHIRGVLEDVINVLDHHPFYRMFDPQITRSPNYRLKVGKVLVESVNMNVTGKKPGAQFFQKHFEKLFIEEASFETDEVYKQRRDSVSENGCIFRIAGMTNFTKYSPCGQNFYDIKKRPWICNLPQYVNPKWDENEKEKAKKDLGGEQSVSFRIFIRGEVVEEGVSVFDMERVRRNYVEKRKTKVFEITKELYDQFKYILILERPNNADVCYIFSDIGESAPTEIGVIFEINKKYRFVYNITLYGLTHKEQYEIFKFLGQLLKANFVAIDCTDGTGRAIFRSLAEVFPKENLVWVGFNEKIPVDFDRDEKGIPIFKNGKPLFKEEYASEWSIKHLKDLLYGERMEIPLDYKFDMQFNSVISMQSGTRTVYSCVSSEDHLFQAFQVFSIAQWYHEFNLIKPIKTKTFAKSGV